MRLRLPEAQLRLEGAVMTVLRPQKAGESHWICRFSHRTETYFLILDDSSLIGGSAWDYCDWCSDTPTLPQLLRMKLDIFNQALNAGLISPQRRQELMGQAVRPDSRRER